MPPSPTPDALEATPAPAELEPAPEGLEPLVPGHNRISADRINLVFAPWGWDDPELFRRVASVFVNWSGRAQLWGPDGLPLGVDDDASTAFEAEVGLFGIEPFRGHRDVFNVWVTAQSPTAPYDWLESTGTPVWAPDQVVVVLAEVDEAGLVASSVAGQGVMLTGLDAPRRAWDQPFANATVAVNEDWVHSAMLDVPHELGHAMFGLADEYVGRRDGYDGFVRNPFWPSCADTQERAESWWSQHVGQYDDQVDYWAAEMTAAGFGPTAQELDAMREQNRTAYVADGCFGVPGSVRSAEDTLMGFNFPAFGVTNRLWAEQVLALWSGD
nr:M64 family metallopeptidase [uncultured Actinotalea sp.]